MMSEKMLKNKPLVSIITPVFNGKEFLEESVKSVLNQTYKKVEHIIVDGGSTDGTLEILKKYASKYPGRIRFISEPDKGTGDAWNKGWKMAKGDIFGWLGSDDMFEPDAISAVVAFFKLNPDAYFVFGNYNVIDDDGKVIRRPAIKDFDLNETINDRCYVPTHASFYRREVVDKVGLIDTSLRLHNDLDYWIRVGKVFKMYRVDNVFSNFRLHKNSSIWHKDRSLRRSLDDEWMRLMVSKKNGGNTFLLYKRYFIFSIISILIFLLRPILLPLFPKIRKGFFRMKGVPDRD